MNHSSEHEDITRPPEQSFLLSHFVHTLRAYAAAIVVAVALTALAFAVIAAVAYLFAPSERITSLGFRLDFAGAAEGRYPNGLKFSSADILANPVLLAVFNQNGLAKYTTPADFARSIFVLESNREYEKLAAQYRARLADPKLTPIDRERIENEFESKRMSLTKNDFSINYRSSDGDAQLPPTLVKKVVRDVLQEWARYAEQRRRVLDYRVPVLSPDAFTSTSADPNDFIVTIQHLRSRIFRVIENIHKLKALPGSETARTAAGRSLADIEALLEDIVRFRLEPLVSVVRSGGLVVNSQATSRYIEAQLAYDRRELEARQTAVDSIHAALAAYDPMLVRPETALPDRTETAPSGTSGPRSETVMPQLSDSFLDRLIALTKHSAGAEYRQQLVSDLRTATLALIPAQQAVAYDEDVLRQLQSAQTGGVGVPAEVVRQQIATAEVDAKRLLTDVNELYTTISNNLDPATELYSVMGVPTTTVERMVSLRELAIWGVVVMLIALPLIVAAVLLHSRLRSEEVAEATAYSSHSTPS